MTRKNKIKKFQKKTNKVEILFYPFVNLKSKWKNLLNKEKPFNNYYLSIGLNIYVYVILPLLLER